MMDDMMRLELDLARFLKDMKTNVHDGFEYSITFVPEREFVVWEIHGMWITCSVFGGGRTLLEARSALVDDLKRKGFIE